MTESEPKFEDEKKEESIRKIGISRIIGVTSKQEKEILESLADPFDLPEEEKTPEQIEVIKGIIDEIPDFIKHYGGVPVHLTLEQVHLLDRGSDNEEIQRKVAEGLDGFYHLKSRSIAVLNSNNNLHDARVLVHEMIHLNSFSSLELREKDKKVLQSRRSGFVIESAKNNIVFFVDIDEAITEELAIRFDKKYFKSIHGLSEKVREREEYVKILKENSEAERADEFEGPSFIEKQGETFKIRNQRYGERKKLKSMIREIYEKNKDDYKFNSTEDVFDLFARAVMSGKLLEVARLIEKTYGKGSFKKLGEETKAK